MSGVEEGADKSKALASNREMITRSNVPKRSDYRLYRNDLRHDFFYSCAYCTIGEYEALTIHFTIDHYEPRKSRPDLINEYNNLMYCCNPCNLYKGQRTPTEAHKSKGYRFFRPDQDVFGDHFEKNGRRLDEKTPIGYFTINGLNLNRKQLVRLRELRDRLHHCEEFVVGGITALRKFPLDQLPQNIKGPAARSISRAVMMGQQIAESIDAMLRANARAEFADDDPEADVNARERKAKLKHIETLEPETWKKNR